MRAVVAADCWHFTVWAWVQQQVVQKKKREMEMVENKDSESQRV